MDKSTQLFTTKTPKKKGQNKQFQSEGLHQAKQEGDEHSNLWKEHPNQGGEKRNQNVFHARKLNQKNGETKEKKRKKFTPKA